MPESNYKILTQEQSLQCEAAEDVINTHIDQRLGKLMQHWLDRPVPKGYCRFCGKKCGAVTCSEDHRQNIMQLSQARDILRTRDVSKRGHE